MKHEPLRPVDAERYDNAQRSVTQEFLADETPVALVYNGRSHAVMMATPADLDDFAFGFTLAEGIVDRIDEIEIVDRLSTAEGISLQMLIPQHRFEALEQRQRNLTGRVGCGLCGVASLSEAIRPVSAVTAEIALSAPMLLEAFRRLANAQPFNDASGALHAAALIAENGDMLVREDIGRHNAIDKVIGGGARQGLRARALLVTSRASYEVVHKAAQANCAIVAAISAPTALAVRIAQEAGIVLVGFARDERLTVYAGALFS